MKLNPLKPLIEVAKKKKQVYERNLQSLEQLHLVKIFTKTTRTLRKPSFNKKKNLNWMNCLNNHPNSDKCNFDEKYPKNILKKFPLKRDSLKVGF